MFIKKVTLTGMVFSLLTAGFVVANASAEEQLSCNSEQAQIIKELKIPTFCNVNEDCTYVDYSYPFQQDACTKAIISTQEQERNVNNVGRINSYLQRCVAPIAEEKEKFIEMQNKIATTDCTHLTPQLICLRNECVIKSIAAHENSIFGGDSPYRSNGIMPNISQDRW